MNRPRSALGALILTSVLLTLSGTGMAPSNAEQPKVGAQETLVRSAKAPFNGDSMAEAYSKKHGVELSVAEDALEAEQQILAVVPTIRAAIPEGRLAGIAIERDPNTHLVVRLTPGPPVDELSKAIAPLGDLVVVTTGSTSVQARLHALHGARGASWRDRIDGMQGVYVDETSDRIVLMIAHDALPAAGALMGPQQSLDFLSRRFGIGPKDLGESNVIIESSTPSTRTAAEGTSRPVPAAGS